jgi:hypothetical protein
MLRQRAKKIPCRAPLDDSDTGMGMPPMEVMKMSMKLTSLNDARREKLMRETLIKLGLRLFRSDKHRQGQENHQHYRVMYDAPMLIDEVEAMIAHRLKMNH